MNLYRPGATRMQRFRSWLAEPAAGTDAGRRLAAARAREVDRARRAARLEEVRARYADAERHEECQRVQASWRCAPQRPADIPADIPAVPGHVPDYLVELVRAPDGTFREPS